MSKVPEINISDSDNIDFTTSTTSKRIPITRIDENEVLIRTNYLSHFFMIIIQDASCLKLWFTYPLPLPQITTSLDILININHQFLSTLRVFMKTPTYY